MAKERNDMIAPSFAASFSSSTESGGLRMEPFKVFIQDGKPYIFGGTMVVHGKVITRETTEIPAAAWAQHKTWHAVPAKHGNTWVIEYRPGKA